MRKSLLAVACTLLCAPASAPAIVGGTDVPAGKHTNVAEITLGMVAGCTGTLVAPGWVMTAGHCGSLTGAVGVAQPVAKFPPQTIEVRLGSNKPGAGTRYAVSEVVVAPDYLATSGYDATLLKMSAPITAVPSTPVANAAERALWSAGTMATAVGWGVTESGGTSPDTLQQVDVPIVADATCAAAYADQNERDFTWRGFDTASMVCAGYPQGGKDTCQGDSGGPLFVRVPDTGALRVAGATSYGEGCAEPGYPGIYARVADTELRSWIASVAPEAIAPST